MTCPIKLTTLAVIISRWTRMVKEYTQQISQIRYVPRKKKATTSWRTMSWPTPLVHLMVSNPQVLPDEERLNRAITPKLPIQLMRPFPDFQIEESHYLECRVNRSEPILNNKSCEALDVFGDQIPKVLKISITSQPTTRRSSDSSVEALSSDMV
ncbi:hypothetical protein DERF_011939 [Dermatophagoides farinae]|uniref:Uncharacterized protein n=1 Tax=Dermatophagoides farinae TaxID=6954 RepID=A0A922HP10_DERFA|nr:hypothetical protein DERF_011939 [Dermatophagoides farinae]